MNQHRTPSPPPGPATAPHTPRADRNAASRASKPAVERIGSRRPRRPRWAAWPACAATLIALWIAAPAQAQLQATIGYVGASLSPLPNSATTSIPIVVPSGVTAGDVMLAVLSNNPTAAGGTAPSGWTNLLSSGNASLEYAIFYRVATSADVGGSTTYTWGSPVSGRVGGMIVAFRGVDNTNPIVANAVQANASSTTRTAPSLTPGVANTMLVALYAVANGNTDTLSSTSGMTQTALGGTQDGTGGVLIAGFYKLWAATTATGTLVVQSGSNLSATSVAASVALRPATVTPVALYHSDESSWNGTAGEVVDSSGNGYNGVAVGGATTAGTSPAIAGATGTCYYGSFNGSTQYVQLPSSLGHLSSTFAITAWIRPTASTYGRIVWDDYAYNGYALSFEDPGSNKLRFYVRNSTSPTNFTNVDSSVSLTLNQWYFVAAILDVLTTKTMTLLVYNSSGTLIDSESVGKSTYITNTGAYATIGGDATGSAEGAVNRFPGNIDEVILYNNNLSTAQITSVAQATHLCANSVPDHYAVSAAASAVNCTPQPVTISAHTSAHANLNTDDTITLGTSTGHGDWTLTGGAGTFAAGASNSGAATYTYASADGGVVSLALRDTYAETVTINVTDGAVTAKSGTALASEDSAITFAPSGFRITNGSNVATTIGTQQSGVTSTQSLALQAVRTDTNTGSCTNLFASGSTVNVSLAYQCNNPTSCVSGQSLTLTNNGTSTSLASNPASGISSYTTVPLKFSTANAEAPFTLDYTDAGQITLAARYALPLGNGSSSANAIYGAGQFVVQPYTLKLSNIKVTSSGLANPAASTASGSVFIGAGQPFTATVTASNFQGNATPNFGQETTMATVTLTPTLVLPSSGHNPALTGSFASYASGSSTATGFGWPEVGIITLTPTVANYLSSGAVTGTTSGNVGRFVPNSFGTALNTPVFGTACTAGSFTYLGQPFTYTVAPVITATALALGGATTQNYTGSLMRLSNGSLTGRSYTPTPVSPGLTLTGLPATSADPAIVDLGTGQVTLTFSAGSGLFFTRGSAIAPFSANISLSENVIDQDGVSASNPVVFGSGSGISFSTSATQLYGRLALRDSLGSELLDLPMPLTTQYYLSTSQGFVTNTLDSCSAAPTLAFSGYQQNLAAGETCVRDSGSPGVSGIGCSAAASSSERYGSVAAAGSFNLYLAAPGSGNTGAVTVTATAPTYLQYLWSVGSGSNSNPSGLATFGVFPAPASRVHQREVY
jgi:MSHA biogenesis protein MshQ